MKSPTWLPQRTARGLTIWTYNTPRRTYVSIRRDVDGMRVVDPRPWMLLPNHSKALYSDFTAAVTEPMAAALTQMDIPCRCAQCRGVWKPHVETLHALLAAHTSRL